MNKFRMILAAGSAMAALAYGVPALAHPEHQATDEVVREIKTVNHDGEKTVEIRKVVKGDKAAGAKIEDGEFVANCGEGRKFESAASSGGDKEKHVNKMVICSDKGESDAEWAQTLRKALARIEADKDVPPQGKAQIMADLKSEIARLGK
jgi:hypothetical protein